MKAALRSVFITLHHATQRQTLCEVMLHLNYASCYTVSALLEVPEDTQVAIALKKCTESRTYFWSYTETSP